MMRRWPWLAWAAMLSLLGGCSKQGGATVSGPDSYFEKPTDKQMARAVADGEVDTVRRLLRSDRPVLRSDGTHVRDYVYVRDVARAYLRTAELLADPAVRGRAFNFSNESPVSVLDLVRTIQRLTGTTHLEPEVRNTAAGEIHSQYLSAEKARRVLRWKPEYDLEAGLRETIDWYREYFAADRPAG